MSKFKTDDSIVNLCYHPVTVKLSDGIYHWESCGKSHQVRVKYKKVSVDEKGDFFEKVPESFENFPKFSWYPKDTRFIVSKKTLDAICELLPHLASKFIAPGDQRPNADSKVTICEGFQICKGDKVCK